MRGGGAQALQFCTYWRACTLNTQHTGTNTHSHTQTRIRTRTHTLSHSNNIDQKRETLTTLQKEYMPEMLPPMVWALYFRPVHVRLTLRYFQYSIHVSVAASVVVVPAQNHDDSRCLLLNVSGQETTASPERTRAAPASAAYTVDTPIPQFDTHFKQSGP